MRQKVTIGGMIQVFVRTTKPVSGKNHRLVDLRSTQPGESPASSRSRSKITENARMVHAAWKVEYRPVCRSVELTADVLFSFLLKPGVAYQVIHTTRHSMVLSVLFGVHTTRERLIKLKTCTSTRVMFFGRSIKGSKAVVHQYLIVKCCT